MPTTRHIREKTYKRKCAHGRRAAFVTSDDSVTGEPTECFNPVAVVMRAEALSRKEGHVGAVAFSRTGDPATGVFSDAKVIKKFGDVPNDLGSLQNTVGV